MSDTKAKGSDTENVVQFPGQVKVSLRAFNSTDVEQARRWRNEWEIFRWCRQYDFISDMDQHEWFKRQHADPTIKMYAVETESHEGKKVFTGVAGLTDISWRNSRAEFSLYVAPELQGNGIGRAALMSLLHHGMVNLGLQQIWGEVFAENPAMKLFEDIGFEKIGTRPNWYYKDGAFIDSDLIVISFQKFLGLSDVV